MTWQGVSTWAVSDGPVSANTLNAKVSVRGVVMVVYGDAAEIALNRAALALSEVCPALPVTVHRERVPGYTDMQQSRHAKVTMLDWSPYQYTAYLDADTQVYQDISAGFEALENGFDLAITPSQNQGERMLWHCGERDKAETLTAVGAESLQLQAGVMFVARNARTRALFDGWRAEWEKYRDQDQGALLRALYQCPVKVWLLGQPWNGGAVCAHHWGSIRRGV